MKMTAPHRASLESGSEPDSQLSELRVLVVDDNASVRAVVVEALSDDGLQVLEAASGNEALLYLSLIPPIDVLFTDIRMPGDVSGWELARRFRAALPTVGIVCTSGFADDKNGLVGGGMFLDKPVRVAHLMPALLASRKAALESASMALDET